MRFLKGVGEVNHSLTVVSDVCLIPCQIWEGPEDPSELVFMAYFQGVPFTFPSIHLELFSLPKACIQPRLCLMLKMLWVKGNPSYRALYCLRLHSLKFLGIVYELLQLVEVLSRMTYLHVPFPPSLVDIFRGVWLLKKSFKVEALNPSFPP